MPRYRDAKLIGGPYARPRVHAGDVLYCELYGESVASRFHGRLQWPSAIRYGQISPILCGDLVDAVRAESVLAICHWFGVSRRLVWKWRKALGIGRMTAGSRRLRRLQTFSAAERIRSAKTVRSQKHRQAQRQRALARWRRKGSFGNARKWTAKELRLLGRFSDSEIARQIGRTECAVTVKRRELRIKLKTV